MTQDEVQVDVTNVTMRLQQAMVANNSICPSPGFIEFRSHTPFKLEVSKEALESGFYSHLNSLQGEHNTWYTGAVYLASLWDPLELYPLAPARCRWRMRLSVGINILSTRVLVF